MKKSHKLIIEWAFFAIIILAIIMISNHLAISGYAIYQDQPSALDGKDSYIRNSSSLNFGTDIVLKVGKTASGLEYRSMLYFNISAVDPGSTILDGILRLYASTNNQQNITISAYMLTSDWNESETTWNNNTASSTWSTEGGDYDSLILLESKNITSAGQYYNFSITQAIRSWVNGSMQNYGIILVPTNVGNNNLTEFASSDNSNSALHPEIIISYTSNAPPYIDLIETNSNLTNWITVGQLVNFSISLTDLEVDPSQIYICNSSNITVEFGCAQTTLCNTSLSSLTTQTCTYTTQQNNNRTSQFWVAACDSINCSQINQSQFYVNHFPIVNLGIPNGGETLNQSLGNYTIRFNVSDSDSDSLTASLYYGSTQNSTLNLIISDLILSNYCTDIDGRTSTTNNCSYSWNTLGLYGEYFLTIILNDSAIQSNDSSNSAFSIRSIIDNEAPNITSQWIDENIYSGKITQIYANVSDSNINTVWAYINLTTPKIVIMRNTSSGFQELYNASFIAPQIGEYQFKIYSNDTPGNINNTMEWINFTVYKPNATTQNELSPIYSLPYSVIKVKGELVALDSLTSVYAYLYTDSGFTFLSGYPQNLLLGNISSSTTQVAEWFLSTPINQSSYTFNITYTDVFGNNWSSNNTITNVTSTIGSDVYSLTIADYPHVAITYPYTAEATFRLNGAPTTPDSLKISLYDPVGNLVIGPIDMLLRQTGIYNYTYIVPNGQTAGQWQTVINATKNSINYYSNSFWKLVGALFDVRNIQIVKDSISDLNISVETENVGNTPVDLTLSWNLTRVDNDQVLDSGAETFAVGASPVTWHVYPTTSYIGQVKITFIGYYSQTEKAGAYKIFSTTSSGQPPVPPTGGDGGGGGGGGGGGSGDSNQTTQNQEDKEDYNLVISKYSDRVYITPGIGKTILISLYNIGKEKLTNINVILDGLANTEYRITPSSLIELLPGESEELSVEFLPSDEVGEKDFIYYAVSEETEYKAQAKLISLYFADYLNIELERLTKLFLELKKNSKDKEIIAKIESCEEILKKAKENTLEEKYIDAKLNLKLTQDCELELQKYLVSDKLEYPFSSPMIILVIGIIILIIAIIGYLIYRRLRILKFFRSEIDKGNETSSKKLKEKEFDSKIKKIEEELED